MSIGILTWGDHLSLVTRCLESIIATAPREMVQIIVAANEPSQRVWAWLEQQRRREVIDHLVLSPVNVFKNPMMREVIRIAHGDYLWWFDDDSHVTHPEAFRHWWNHVESSSPRIVGWGATAYALEFEGFPTMDHAREWVRAARWYRGLEPPGANGTSPEWWFLAGGCWWMRLSALRALDWPDPRLRHVAEDILLGEAIRQQGWNIANIAYPGVEISDAPRRGRASAAVPLW